MKRRAWANFGKKVWRLSFTECLHTFRLLLWQKRNLQSWKQTWQHFEHNWKKAWIYCFQSCQKVSYFLTCPEFLARNIQGSDVAKLMLMCEEAKVRELSQIELTVSLNQKVLVFWPLVLLGVRWSFFQFVAAERIWKYYFKDEGGGLWHEKLFPVFLTHLQERPFSETRTN